MADLSNFHRERAEERAEEERDAAVKAASKALQGGGFHDCIDCGIPIPPRRRSVLPSAKRCFECQDAYEMQQVMK
jgi:phage/conjugal plasmid C-4 type zinc finger TraR family protein